MIVVVASRSSTFAGVLVNYHQVLSGKALRGVPNDWWRDMVASRSSSMTAAQFGSVSRRRQSVHLTPFIDGRGVREEGRGEGIGCHKR